MRRLPRTLLGFTLAPMPLFLLLCGFSIAADRFWSEAALTAALLALFTHGLTLLFGLPAHMVLLRFGRRRLRHYLVAGLALPIVVLVGMFLVSVGQAFSGSGTAALMPAMLMAMLTIPCAEATAALFWLIAVWRTPEQDVVPIAVLVATFE